MAELEKLVRLLKLREDSKKGSIDAEDEYWSEMDGMGEVEAKKQLKMISELRPDTLVGLHKERGFTREEVEEIYLGAGLSSEKIDSLFPEE